MLISFAPDGSIEFTRTPTLLALFPDDAKRMERMTDILFNEDFQRYYVWFKTGPASIRGTAFGILTRGYAEFSHEDRAIIDLPFKVHTEAHGLITFDTYEDAVKAEIAFVEFLRAHGYSMTL